MTTTSETVENANIARWLADQAAAHPQAPAIKLGETVLSFARLEAASQRAATQLAEAGIGPGDRVAMIMPNLPYFPIYYYAVLRLGAVVVPMNPLLRAGEIGYIWRDANVRAAVVFTMFAEEARQAAAEQAGPVLLIVTPGETDALLSALEPTPQVLDRDPSDTAVILYTSGTTGQPKGAELTHDNIGSNVRTVLETLFPMEPGDVIFGGLPLFHSFGQTVCLNAGIAAGACITLLPKFDPAQALAMIDSDQVTVFMGVPSMYVALLNTPGEVAATSLQRCVSGGSSLPVEVLHGIEERFGCGLQEGYGLSETSPVASFNHPDRPAKPGSIGTPIRGCEFILVDADGQEITQADQPGEICIRGENVMKGYLHQPEETAIAMRGGWFHTGDLARRDADGYYFIVDRVKDMIIRNGFNVYPREIEEVLYTHPAVQEVAVVAIAHPQYGEEIGALVTLKEGASATAEELINFAKERVAAYKYPRQVVFGPIPKGPTGKILKREIHLSLS